MSSLSKYVLIIKNIDLVNFDYDIWLYSIYTN